MSTRKKKDKSLPAKKHVSPSVTKDLIQATSCLALYANGYDAFQISQITQVNLPNIKTWQAAQFPEDWDVAKEKRQSELKESRKKNLMCWQEYSAAIQEIILSAIRRLHNHIVRAPIIEPALALQYLESLTRISRDLTIDPVIVLQAKSNNPNVNILAFHTQNNGQTHNQNIIEMDEPSNFMKVLEGQWEKQQVKNGSLPAKT